MLLIDLEYIISKQRLEYMVKLFNIYQKDVILLRVMDLIVYLIVYNI